MAAECVVCVDNRMADCVGVIVCIGLNSLPSVGGRMEVGTVPGNVGDTAMNRRRKK